MRPKTNTKYFEDFNDFGKPFEQQSDIPAIKPYVPPNSYDPPQFPIEQKRDFNDNFVEQQKSPPNQSLQPKKAALVNNYHFEIYCIEKFAIKDVFVSPINSDYKSYVLVFQ